MRGCLKRWKKLFKHRFQNRSLPEFLLCRMPSLVRPTRALRMITSALRSVWWMELSSLSTSFLELKSYSLKNTPPASLVWLSLKIKALSVAAFAEESIFQILKILRNNMQVSKRLICVSRCARTCRIERFQWQLWSALKSLVSPWQLISKETVDFTTCWDSKRSPKLQQGTWEWMK